MKWKLWGKQVLAFASSSSPPPPPPPPPLSLTRFQNRGWSASTGRLVRSFSYPCSASRELFRFESQKKRSLTSRSGLTSYLEPEKEESASNDDLLQWERMYEAGKRQSSIMDESLSATASQKFPVRVVSFDLDNTLWKTSATIDSANDVLAAFLKEQSVVQIQRVEKIMGDLFAQNKARYCPIDKDTAKAPVLLTLLRKDAIRHVLEQENGFRAEDAITMADKAFDIWFQARHDAIQCHLAENVVATLNAISTIQTANGNNVKVIAITDGNSNPNMVECLTDVFEFVVNAEQVGVSKPDKRLYLEAARILFASNDGDHFSDLLSGSRQLQQMMDQPTTWSDELLEDLIGPWWVHIGDDFLKDIVAAKGLNMRSIWVKELVENAVATISKSSSSVLPERQKRTVEDLVRQVSEMQVIEMEVGADDYLAQSLQAEFADAVVDRFADLHSVLLEWHNEANDNNAMVTIVEDDGISKVVPTVTSAANQAQTTGEAASPSVPPAAAVKTNKFCMFCGEKLILEEARFCSFCGKPQSS